MDIKAWRKYWIEIALVLILGVSLILRFWSLGKIGDKIFDEVYFVDFAEKYITHTSFFDIHPPLGKLIIALGLKVFGDTSFTWRLMPALFGEGLILLGYFTGKELKNKLTGLFVAAILAFDGMILVYSRTGLLDIFLVFFILLCFYLFLKFIKTEKLGYLITAGIAMGLAASVKYIGALVLPVLWVMANIKQNILRKYWWQGILVLGLLPITVYLLFFLFNFGTANFFHQVAEWHSQSFGYNFNLTESHPYGSKWWTWFLLLRPIWFYFKDTGGKYIGIDGMGNPLAWWSSLAVVPLLIWGTAKKYQYNLPILIGFLLFLLFWAPFHRVLFMYHALPSFAFLTLGTAWWLEELYQKYYGGRYLVAVYFIILIGLFVFFLPIWLGLPLDSGAFYHRIWLKGWI